jgi:SAM-dependent methyltransferase
MDRFRCWLSLKEQHFYMDRFRCWLSLKEQHFYMDRFSCWLSLKEQHFYMAIYHIITFSVSLILHYYISHYNILCKSNSTLLYITLTTCSSLMLPKVKVQCIYLLWFQLIIAAQCFHWFASPESLQEIYRVLVPGGRFGMILLYYYRWLKNYIVVPTDFTYLSWWRNGKCGSEMCNFQ